MLDLNALDFQPQIKAHALWDWGIPLLASPMDSTVTAVIVESVGIGIFFHLCIQTDGNLIGSAAALS